MTDTSLFRAFCQQRPSSGDARTQATGIRVAASDEASTRDAVVEVVRDLGAGPFQHIIVFFSRHHDATLLSAALAEALPGVAISGCSTAGEITPMGMMQGSLVAFAFPTDGFRIISDVIECQNLEMANAVTKRLVARAGIKNSRGPNEGFFAILLIDGLSNREEFLVGAISWELGSIPLVGGSAGDDQQFESTDLIHNGSARKKAAILIVGESMYPFCTFSTHNLRPKSVKVVVTRADPASRLVAEFNGEPAATEYAHAVGVPAEQLGPHSFASYPLVVKVGDGYYCRAVRSINPDGSLLFACAVDEGLVLTAADLENIVESTSKELASVEEELGRVDAVLGFDCVFRRLEAENSQSRLFLENLYKKYNVVGFNTYGEQYNGLHLNHTLTGIAFGRGK